MLISNGLGLSVEDGTISSMLGKKLKWGLH